MSERCFYIHLGHIVEAFTKETDAVELRELPSMLSTGMHE